MTASMICARKDSICLWQPSPAAEMAIRAAWRNFQSGSWSMCGVFCRMYGKTVFPPRPQASLSRADSATTALLSPSSSAASSARAHSSSSSSSISVIMWRTAPTAASTRADATLRTMAGAVSASVTTTSRARWRHDSICGEEKTQ